MHSNLNYMENELIAKPTPKNNPMLSHKINMLYHLLTGKGPSNAHIQPEIKTTASDIMAIYGIESEDSLNNELKLMPRKPIDPEAIDFVSLVEPKNDVASSSSSSSAKPNLSNGISCNGDDVEFISFIPPTEVVRRISKRPSRSSRSSRSSDDRQAIPLEDRMDVNNYEFESDDNVENHFENAHIGLRLPIAIEPTQRMLMLALGDDFTHIWFQMYRKFISRRNIIQCLKRSITDKTPIEVSTSPIVYVTHTHDRCIFIGPYGIEDKQNVLLCVHQNNRMIPAKVYEQKCPNPDRLKTKGKQFPIRLCTSMR